MGEEREALLQLVDVYSDLRITEREWTEERGALLSLANFIVGVQEEVADALSTLQWRQQEKLRELCDAASDGGADVGDVCARVLGACWAAFGDRARLPSARLPDRRRPTATTARSSTRCTTTATRRTSRSTRPSRRNLPRKARNQTASGSTWQSATRPAKRDHHHQVREHRELGF